MKESNTNTNEPPPTTSALNPNIASVILHTVQYMLSSVLVRRICIIIKNVLLAFPVFSQPLFLIEQSYQEEK